MYEALGCRNTQYEEVIICEDSDGKWTDACEVCNDGREDWEHVWFANNEEGCQFDTCKDWRGTEYQARKGACPADWESTVCYDDDMLEHWDCDVCSSFGTGDEDYVSVDCNWQQCEDEEGNFFKAPEACPSYPMGVHTCVGDDKVEHWDGEKCYDDDGDYYISYPECPWNENDGWAAKGICFYPTEE